MHTQEPSINLQGVCTALVTPFTPDGSAVDTDSLRRLIEVQLAAGVRGVVPCGSTGEAVTLTPEEYSLVVRTAREVTRGRCLCIAGISVSSTAVAVELARHLRSLEVDGILVASPPYNKPSQAGIAAHIRAVKAASGLPIIAYNIPGRTAVAITPTTLAELVQDNTIVGIKESSGSMDTVIDTIQAVGPACQVLSGEDSLFLGTLAYGGAGIISASANALPGEFVGVAEAFFAGRIQQAREIQMGMLERIRTLFIESNPVPVKTVLARQGVISSAAVRLPLVPLTPTSQERLAAVFGW
jgi:4-hydroxy-tetrahydrodipicolinate synthase